MKQVHLKRKQLMYKVLLLIPSCLLVFALIAQMCFHHVESNTEASTFDAVQLVPYQKVALVLGTSKRIRDGRQNLFFNYRMDAAEALFKAGKVNYLVLSGDNGSIYYNEPQDMKNELVQRGIPAERIYLDYAGFRTFDSVIRMNAIFGQSSFTIVSQEFHNRRAVFIAQSMGLNAVGFNAKTVSAYGGMKTMLREYLARVKVILDLWLSAEPRFLGEPIAIP